MHYSTHIIHNHNQLSFEEKAPESTEKKNHYFKEYTMVGKNSFSLNENNKIQVKHRFLQNDSKEFLYLVNFLNAFNIRRKHTL